MEMSTGTEKSKAWIFYTLLFVFITLVIFTMINWNPLLGCVCLFLTFLTIIVGSILKAFFNNGNIGNRTIVLLDMEELKGSQRLLRYATAILAFLSLLTTANGMKSFVFSESWMAYLASFAVQSILVVFSLLLCRFFVQVIDLGWALYIKRIVNGIMVVFFCTALIVSSIFSFSFIANNAYKKTWSSDSETIIQEFLIKEINMLKIENEKRGKLIISSINNEICEKIKGIVDESKTNKINNGEEQINNFVGNFSKEKLQKGKVSINKRELLETYPQYKNDVNFLCENYKIYSDQYDSSITLYNKVVKGVKKWNKTIESESIYNQSEQWLDEIDSMCTNLKKSKTNIENLRTYKLNIDFSAVRSKYNQETDVLLSRFLEVRKDLKKINKISSEIKSNLDKNNNDELDRILSKIYLLGVTKQDDIENLVKDINDIAISASKGDTSNSEAIKNIVSIKNQLNDYSDYLNLKSDIIEFEKEHIRKTYIIKLDNQKKINTSNNEIKYTDWKKQRNQDFTAFVTYVKSLPDVSNKNEEEYNANNVLDTATTYQRDLLGTLTEFEKAFNYFKYKYPVMAFFSAFIAIFFDLGSFFTGCFLYATEYFETSSIRKKGENKI